MTTVLFWQGLAYSKSHILSKAERITMLTTHLIPSDYPEEPGLPNARQVPINYAQHPGIRKYPLIFSQKKCCAPAATIVTPIYKTFEYVNETANSVFNQTFQQFEWIIVDDGNTDADTLAALQQIQERDSRVRIIRQNTNRGVSAARNMAMEYAQSDYLLLLDSDDSIEPGTLEKLFWRMYTWPEIAFARGYSVGFAACNYVLFAGFHMREVFIKNNMANLSGTMISPSRLKGLRYNENRKTGLEDWEFWLHCASEGVWGGSIYECCDWYRRRVTHTDRWEAYDAEKFEEFLRDMRTEFPALWDKNFEFPDPQAPPELSYYSELPEILPCENVLAKRKQRIVLILDSLRGCNREWLNNVRQMFDANCEVSIVVVGSGQHELASAMYAITPEVYILSKFIDTANYASFIVYLLLSRQADIAIVDGKISSAYAPYLLSKCNIKLAVPEDHKYSLPTMLISSIEKKPLPGVAFATLKFLQLASSVSSAEAARFLFDALK